MDRDRAVKTRFNATCLVILATLAVAPLALAHDNDGTLICATVHTIECDGHERTCEHGPAESINVPRFFRLDLEQRKIRLMDQGRTEEFTDIEIFDRTDPAGVIILGGVEDGRGWTMQLMEASGKFSLLITEDYASFTAFGECTVP